MKILAINTSPRAGKTTAFALEKSLDAVRDTSIELDTELMELGGLDIRYCTGCNACKSMLSCRLDDDFNSLIERLADDEIKGIIIGTPVYLGSMTGLCKSFLDRSCMMRRNGYLWQDKVCGVLATGGARNGGQELTIQAVHAAFLVQNAIIVSDGEPTCHFGGTVWTGAEGSVESDDWGLATACGLGRRVAQTVLRMNT